MNKKFYYLIVAFLATASVFAQAPEKMSYQAVIRNADNALVTNQQIAMKISILETTVTGSAVYVETHTPTTNANGLVTIEIGAGNTTLGVFSAIDWVTGSFFTKTQIDPTGGTSYTITGTSELLSVPYALYAKASGSGVTDLNALSDVLLENNSMYIGTKPATALDAAKWNLAVGKGALQSNTSGARNTAVGYYALRTNTLGSQSTAIGRSALYNNDDGESNTAIGNYALYDNTSGFRNTTSGAGGLRKNISGSRNTASGHYALRENTTGNYNTAIGYEADANANDLNNATAIGANAVVGASNTIQLGDTDVIAVITSGNITASSFTTSAGAILNAQASGTTPGDMQYWNGTAWELVIGTQKEGAALQMIGGMPTWVGGVPANIGDLREGGIVFWIDPSDNTKGLVCALEDQSAGIQWYNGTHVRTNAKNITIGTGAVNTTRIIEKQGVTETDYAAGLARAYSGGGYDDWFLPSKNELNEMHKNRDVLEATVGFSVFNDYYWSSTEKDGDWAFQQMFATDKYGIYAVDKSTTYISVRAVRAF